MAWGARPTNSSTAEFDRLLQRISTTSKATKASFVVLRSRHLLDGPAVARLSDALRVSQLDELILAGHEITVEDCRVLGEALAGHPTLQKLSLGHETFGDAALASLLGGKTLGKSLESLDLEWRSLGPSSGPYLGNLLQHTPSLRVLKLARNKLGDAGVVALAEALQGRTAPLELLDLRENECGEIGAKALAQASRSSSQPMMVAHLDLSHNALGASGVGALKDVACHHLKLDACGAGDEGFLELCSGTQARKSLWVSSNDITAKSVGKAVTTLMTRCEELECLDLSRNGEVRDEGVADIEKALKGRAIRTLDLSHLNAGRVPHSVVVGGDVHTLTFVGNTMTAPIEDLVSTLIEAKVQVLSLSGAMLSKDQLLQLFNALKEQDESAATLHQLELGGHSLDAETREALDALRAVRSDLDIAVDKPT